MSLQLIRLVNANDLIGCGGDTSPMRFMHGGVWRVCIIVCPLLPLIGNLKFEAYFDLLYPL